MEEDHKFEFLVILDYKVRLSLKQNTPPPNSGSIKTGCFQLSYVPRRA